MSDDAQEWRWVGEDGVQKTVPEQELIAGLSSEAVPNYTLVWCRGWLEWLPAMQVEQLAWALPPGKSDEPTRARESATAETPPAPPLYRYAVLKRRAAALRADRSPPKAPTAPRPAARKPPDGALLAAVSADPKTVPFDRALDSNPFEEVDMAAIEASNPSGSSEPRQGKPGDEEEDEEDEKDEEDDDLIEPELDSAPEEPSSPLSRRAYGEEDDAETRVIPSRPPPPGPTYVAPHVPPASERPPPSYPDDPEELPRIPPPPRPPTDLAEYTNAGRKRETLPPRRPDVVYVLAGVVVALVVAVLFLLLRDRGSGDDAARGVASAEPPSTSSEPVMAAGTPPAESAPRERAPQPRPAAPAPVGNPCTLLTPATKVADWAEPSVLQSFAPIPGSSRIAVGFGQSDVYAIGITIDPRTLDRDQVFREFRNSKLVSVVPTAGVGKLQFQVVRSGDSLSNARAVDAEKPFTLGTDEGALSRQVGRRSPEAIWDIDGAGAITVPRVATVPNVGHAVAFRRGGRAGKVALGWLEPDGRRRSPLVDIAAPGDFAGTPSIAANDSAILVAFAVRSESTKEWELAIATAEHGALPKSAMRFPLPPGGPGGDVISPSVAALSGNRWLLQWTEGKAGKRVVRVQVLDRELRPFSEALSVSPDGANAGQGTAWTSGSVAAVLFYVQNDKKSHELWGSSIECPR